jgi:hypothetical protein
LNSIKIKGLGLGRFIFEDKTAQMRLSNVELEIARNYTLTTGVIYADGPTKITQEIKH